MNMVTLLFYSHLFFLSGTSPISDAQPPNVLKDTSSVVPPPYIPPQNNELEHVPPPSYEQT